MKFGLFYELSVPRPWVRLADELGFDQVWAVEHHHATAGRGVKTIITPRARRLRRTPEGEEDRSAIPTATSSSTSSKESSA